MNVRKFVAANARDALRKVKDTLGHDAIILSNRGVPGGVEIMAVASRDMAMIVPPANNAEMSRQRLSRPRQDGEDDYTVNLSASAHRTTGNTAFASPRPAATLAGAVAARESSPTPHPAPRAAMPQAGQVGSAMAPRHPSGGGGSSDMVPAAVMDEIRALRSIVEQHLSGFAWGEMARNEPAKTQVLKQLLDSGFSPKLSRELIAEAPTDLNVADTMNWAKSTADRALLTLNNESDIIDQGGVFALVGPTGVGKTTTTAKLAARCVMRHGADKVALVTTDGYRIGAHEQLRIYGRILGVPVFLVKDAIDLQHTLKELAHKHMVLIDTMGMSQKDRHVAEQISMLSGCKVRRLLLLAATARGDTLDDVVQAYRGDGLAGCILTKIDEAMTMATGLDAVMRHRLRVFYVSNGQRVPEDLHLPNRAYLLHRAFKEAPENSPHRYKGAEAAMAMAAGGLLPGRQNA
jgi:flagellar biosynthesis protein FlhF